MFPWMRDQIAEAWHNRKSSRTAERRSMALPLVDGANSGRNTMLVSLGATSESFSVNVIGVKGNILEIPVRPDFTIDKIKSIAIKDFYGQDKVSSEFHLIHSAKLTQLTDTCTVNDEQINEYDELILVEVRQNGRKLNLSDVAVKGPTEDAIVKATSELAVRNRPRPAPSADCPADFQNEIRKILITLVQASARILTYSPHAAKFSEILREKLEARCKPTIDQKILKTLVQMGYSREKVVKALRLRKSNMTEALEWLIEHQDDPNDAEWNFETEIDAGPSSSGKEAFGNPENRENLVKIVDLLLESFRLYKRMDFKPNPRAMRSLIEMGFEEKPVIAALKVTGNDQANACEWLLGKRWRSLQDLDDGLDLDGPIYKAIMNNPHVQLSLTNPKILLAYLSMLEIPDSTNIWNNDPEVSPVLGQIFKTYHAEKHAIHMNRYTNN